MTYEVSVVNNEGCLDKDTTAIKLIVPIYIPNAFSPNSDGINDKFFIYVNHAELFHVESLLIFDRWGNVVYGANDFPPNDPQYGWDGFYLGELMNPAVFVYHATIIYKETGREFFREGEVTLMR